MFVRWCGTVRVVFFTDLCLAYVPLAFSQGFCWRAAVKQAEARFQSPPMETLKNGSRVCPVSPTGLRQAGGGFGREAPPPTVLVPLASRNLRATRACPTRSISPLTLGSDQCHAFSLLGNLDTRLRRCRRRNSCGDSRPRSGRKAALTSTCITTCKKAPPPVPPRTTSKPFISVTVQSSTDPPRCPPQHDILKITTTCARPDPLPKRKLSSIGIQVDCNQPVPNQDTPPLARFQSIGVQVEDGWHGCPAEVSLQQLQNSSHPHPQTAPRLWFSGQSALRCMPVASAASSSMASKQETDTDTQDLPSAKPFHKTAVVNSGSQAADSPPHRHQDNGEGGAPRPLTSRTSSCSFPESLDPALDPSSLPPPDPWLESVGTAAFLLAPPLPGASACRRDGHWFLKLLQAETARMEGWCQQMEQETKDNQLTEEVLGKVRSAVGSAQLLISQKFQQFRGLCDQNLNLSSNPRPTAQDLAGFWDLLQLSIEDISMKFDELYHLKSNDWQLADSPEEKEEKKQPPPVPKKPSKAKMAAGREKVGQPDPSTDKQRQEARKRLMAAKRAASVRQNSATESADSIEIYVPEAQTRL
ncbi:hypothetical protein SKAU_G00304020 [Synaphobranchus kaupii]|uniref:Disks large-associated protein 4 n=1 Tax=Synaphobranchus kaupii TaxID=118154 RepID=A0A9Q1EW76_SYNKA|nr:hypothetical protein SKAU_G00304020 [Synaphobranchus kaupii]